MVIGFKDLVLPKNTNQHGLLFGGDTLGNMDKAAGNILRRYTDQKFVTKAINQMLFIHPVKLGDILTIQGMISKKGKTSCIVKVLAFTGSSTQKLCASAEFVFVAIDHNLNKRDFEWNV